MPLNSGTRFGSYEIVSPLGAGGMGEVYRATDTKLKRQVAIKVLPASLAGDSERLARFQREAEVLAALNHPHIAAIYGLEEKDGVTALVMELVEGDDLSRAIPSSGMPVAEVLAIARQIAEALEAAHEQGIIHRDLKPANIKVTPDGTVKVLDFGLAKALDPKASTASLENSPTITSPAMTGVGIILGTAAYMSPEQARGRVVDKRTDIWAFGVVLYEMLTGKRTFEGEDVSLTLAAVMKSDPDLTALPADLPPSIRMILRYCLQKDPKQRLRDIGDVRLALDGAFDTPARPSIAAPRPHRPGWRRALAPTAAAIVAGTVMGLAMWNARAPDAKHVTRFEHILPDQVPFKDSNRPLIAVSPDGRRLAYNTADGLYLHTLAEPEDRRLIAQLANLSSPFFSPDGEQVAYHDGTRLQRVPVSGGAPIPIAETPNPFGATWADDDRIYFAAGGGLGGIWRVDASGGTPELLIPSQNGRQLSSPQVMPDGDTILFAASVAAANTVMLRSLRSGQQTVLVDGASNPRYVAAGYLLYTIGDDLFAVAFDPRTRTTRAGVPVVAGIRRGVAPGGAQIANYDVSRDGSLVYVPGGSDESAHQLVWVTRDGTATPITAIAGAPFASPRLSSDDRRALVVAHGDARIYELATGRETRITTDRVTGVYAEWVPGEQSVAYSSARKGKEGPMNVWVHPLDGSGNAYQLTALRGLVHLDAFAPDGRSLAVHHHPGTSTILLTLPHAADASPKPLHPGAVRQESAVFSPDGRYVAYLDSITDRSEVVIRPFPGPGPPTPVSVGGAREPAWARNGELFYRRLVDDAMMVVRVTTSPALTVGEPTELFRGPGHPGGSPRASYAVTADGKRFLMSGARVAAPAQAANTPLSRVKIVLNFFEELKQRIPTG